MSTIMEMAEVHAARIAERDATIATLTAEIERLREALTPSVFTKAAYLGKFYFSMEVPDEDGYPVEASIGVPWTSIKDIMSAIRTRAALQPKEGEQ